MIIKNKTVYVYDIEIFINVFHAVVINSETKEYYYFEISERRNDITKIVNFFHCKDNDPEMSCYLCDDKMFCGYNNIHYDNVIINYIIDQYHKMKNLNYFQITKSLFNLSNTIISDNDKNRDLWKKWKYLKYFDSVDLLTMRFSQKLRVGLKETQITMQYPNVEEYAGDFSKPLPLDKYEEMISYNKNDSESTLCLLEKSKDLIDLRLGIEEEYGVECLSKDGMTIGMEILKIKYLEKTGKTWEEIKDLKSPCDTIALNEVILPIVEFKTPMLQDLLTDMKQQIISLDRKGFERKFYWDDLCVSVSVGGIHSINKPEIVIPNENQYLYDSDVASLYPSLSISYEFIPPHLGKEFLEVYAGIRNERLEAKRNKQKIKNETLKLSINGESGNLQQQYSWIYSPKTAYQIRINGQLLLLMLCERLKSLGARIIQINTDGVLYLIDKDQKDNLQIQLKEWEKQTKLELETDEFEAFYQYAINDYFGVLKGYSETKDPKLIKKKGMFITDVVLGRGMNPKIIPETVIEYFLNGVNVLEYIKNCKDLHKFITYQKIGKQFKTYYGDKHIVHINRFYYSTNGSYLLKYDPVRDITINVNTKSGVTIVNKLTSNEIPDNVNYNYYAQEIMDIINDMRYKQLSLF